LGPAVEPCIRLGVWTSDEQIVCDEQIIGAREPLFQVVSDWQASCLEFVVESIIEDLHVYPGVVTDVYFSRRPDFAPMTMLFQIRAECVPSEIFRAEFCRCVSIQLLWINKPTRLPPAWLA